MSGQTPTGNQVSAIIDAFLDWCELHRSLGTYAWYKVRCELFWESLKARDLKYLAAEELRPHHLEDWLLEHPTWNPGMRRTALRAVERAFNWAVKQGRIERSPIAGMEKPPQGRRENLITPEMYVTILGKVKGAAFRDLLIAAWEIGCRPQEIIRVEARHFQGDRWVFPAKESKGKKRIRVVHLTPTAEAITVRQARMFPKGPIFRNCRAKPWTPFAINCRFCRLQKKIGHKFALVEFRHSFVTRLLKAGSDPITVSALCGHADLSMIAKVQLFHNLSGVSSMMINGRTYMGNTPTMIAGRETRMRFGVVGMGNSGSGIHTFHIHGHRWIVPGPQGNTPGAIQGSAQVQPVSQFEDTRIFGPANSFVFTIDGKSGSFMRAGGGKIPTIRSANGTCTATSWIT